MATPKEAEVDIHPTFVGVNNSKRGKTIFERWSQDIAQEPLFIDDPVIVGHAGHPFGTDRPR
ncbi:hypothetical protein AJ87_48185 [Rhizobium yanglingense]|nr:hypothetical protein AJ87_48185 [Rhizobium yanglingense]